MRVLCVCQNGNSRSAALAWMLKKRHHDALAVGVDAASTETLRMLYEWAEVILLTDRTYTNRIPAEYKDKVQDYHVGPDVWFRGYNHDLVAKYELLSASKPILPKSYVALEWESPAIECPKCHVIKDKKGNPFTAQTLEEHCFDDHAITVADDDELDAIIEDLEWDYA